MFKNIGKKIKVLAKVLCWIGIVLSVLLGLSVILLSFSGGVDASLNGTPVNVSGVGAIIAGILIMIVGSLVSWISSFVTYGFGQVVDNTDKMVNKED